VPVATIARGAIRDDRHRGTDRPLKRLVVVFDAVFAIAITFLAIDVHVQHLALHAPGIDDVYAMLRPTPPGAGAPRRRQTPTPAPSGGTAPPVPAWG